MFIFLYYVLYLLERKIFPCQSFLRRNNKIFVITRPLYVPVFPSVFLAVPCVCVCVRVCVCVCVCVCVQTVSFFSKLKTQKQNIFLFVSLLLISVQLNKRVSERNNTPKAVQCA